MNKDFSYYVTKYFSDYLPNQMGVSKNTIISYRTTFIQLLEFLREKYDINIINITFNDFNSEKIEKFLESLEDTKKISISTRNQKLATIHSFFKYVQKRELSYFTLCNDILTVEHKKAPQVIVSYLSVEEIKYLFKIPNIKDKHEFRDLTILTLLYETGARVQELIDLKLNSLRLTENPTIEVHGKGNKKRTIPISNEVSKILIKYINDNNISDSDEVLFKNKQNLPLTRVGIQYIIDKYITIGKQKQSRYYDKKVSPHTFRHSKAMHLLEAGVNLIYIRDILGHSSIITTEIYAKTNPNIKRDIINKNSEAIKVSSKYDNSSKQNLLNWLKTR